MMASIAEQKQRFRSTANKEFALQQHAERVAALDPTQFRVYQSIQTWSNQCATLPPLRLLVLGTAGTGKTFTLKCAVEAARMAWNSFESVLLTAHTGVAAVNMGGGAATINSIFKMGGNNADVDLDGDKLEELVEQLSETKLVIIDEISTVGAAQFEMVSRTHLFLHLHIL
jgi:DNA replication protein DnaC